MPDTTTIQSLPLIQPSQAQKHVTHNEALKILDLIVQMTVASRSVAVPPATPTNGDAYIIAAGASGVWAGHVGQATTFTGIVWEFYPPKTGWTAYVVDEATAVAFDGTDWTSAAENPGLFAQVGVSATPDATNRLAVSSPASLFSHDGAGHQIKVNKALATDTASLLFQTGFSGRAEMGTAGSDNFAIKVSADGTTFTEAVEFDAATGRTVVEHGLRLTPAAGDLASPVDGEIWYDSTAAKFRAHENGANVDLISAGGGGGGGSSFLDSAFVIQDNADPSKQLKFEVNGLSTGTTRVITAPDASGTLVTADATQTLTNKTINLAANTVTGTLASTSVGMTGGGTAQDYAGFSTRAAFVAWATGKTPATGAVIDAAGYSYRYIASGTAIADLPGWVPLGYAYPDHWAQNLSPGVTDMLAAMTSALGYSATVYMSGGILCGQRHSGVEQRHPDRQQRPRHGADQDPGPVGTDPGRAGHHCAGAVVHRARRPDQL